MLPAFAAQEPIGLDAGGRDEAEKDQAGEGDAGLVIGPGPDGDLQSLGQERRAMFAI